MGEPLHDIDKLFYDNIEGHSEYPPRKVWDKIEAGLDKNTAVIYKKKYQTLKRAAVILLILFLGVLLYEIVGRRPGRETVAGTSKKNVQQGNNTAQPTGNMNNPVKKEDNGPASQEKNNNTMSPDQEGNSVSREKTLQDHSSPVVSPPNENKVNGIKKDVANTTASLKKETHPDEENQVIHKQKTPGSDMQNKVVFEITPSVNKGKRKTNNHKDSLVTAETISPDEIQAVGPAKRYFALLTPADSWKKDITPGWNSSLNLPENGSLSILEKLNYPVVKKHVNPAFRNYGFSLSAYFSPNATWNSIADDKPYRPGSGGGGRIEDHEEIKRSERNSFAYSGGIKLGYGLSKKISIQTGISYTKSLSSVRPKDIYAEQDNNGNILYRFDCSSGYTYIPPHSGVTPPIGDTITVTDNRNTLSYLGIPLEVEYRISFGKFSLSAAAGGQANILLQGTTTAVLGKGTSDETSASSKTQGLRPGYFSAITSITGEWQLNNKLSLTLAPSGQFGLTSINDGASVKTRPNYLGLAAGLKLKL
ncbi:MAG: outer membrane beta-barrel protein [Bacteroidota bacterium]|nr:outer membrane beta-barrel protein [Bacteroidota bacterium]